MAEHNTNILLVEDDEDDQELITHAFSELDKKYNVTIANNGLEAIEYLNQLPDHELPCLIILDINMPVLNGIETLQVLKGLDKYTGIPKVMFTTSDSREYKEKSLSNGATDYMVKPAEIKGLVNAVEKMVSFCSRKN